MLYSKCQTRASLTMSVTSVKSTGVRKNKRLSVPLSHCTIAGLSEHLTILLITPVLFLFMSTSLLWKRCMRTSDSLSSLFRGMKVIEHWKLSAQYSIITTFYIAKLLAVQPLGWPQYLPRFVTSIAMPLQIKHGGVIFVFQACVSWPHELCGRTVSIRAITFVAYICSTMFRKHKLCFQTLTLLTCHSTWIQYKTKVFFKGKQEDKSSYFPFVCALFTFTVSLTSNSQHVADGALQLLS